MWGTILLSVRPWAPDLKQKQVGSGGFLGFWFWFWFSSRVQRGDETQAHSLSGSVVLMLEASLHPVPDVLEPEPQVHVSTKLHQNQQNQTHTGPSGLGSVRAPFLLCHDFLFLSNLTSCHQSIRTKLGSKVLRSLSELFSRFNSQFNQNSRPTEPLSVRTHPDWCRWGESGRI